MLGKDEHGAAAKNRGAIFIVALGTLLAVLDLGIINISLPSIAQGIGVPAPQAVWVATVFQLACASTLMICSTVSTIIGRRPIYVGGLLLYAGGSLGASLSQHFEMLIGFRILQGLGAAALFSLGPSLLRSLYPPHQLGRALGLNALIVGLGLAAGPSLGGLMLSLADWPWIFVINVPVGLAAAWLAWLTLPRDPLQQALFDWQGALLSAIAMGCFLLAIERLGHDTPALAVALLALSLAVGWCFVGRQRVASKPLLPLEIFHEPRFSLATVITLFAFTAQGAVFVSLALIYQLRMEMTPLQAALFFTPWPLALLLSGPLAGYLSDKIRPSLLSTFGLAVFCVGLVGLTWASQVHSASLLLVFSLICGLGYGFFQAPNNHEIMAHAPLALNAIASGVLASVRVLGQCLGSALVALALSLALGLDSALWAASAISLAALLISIKRLSFATLSPPLEESR